MAARAAWLASNLPLQRVPATPNEIALPRAQVRAYRAIKPLMRIRNWFARKRS
jgi:hypothetical protein